ncbi:putative RNA-directed DNA polymerase, eukaryota, reverse transcriptase zinc-binding domain protein [Tanacetum coccineum]
MKKTPGQLVKCCVCEALSVKGRGHRSISNRMKESLSDLVSLNQSVFVPGRRISDNILLTQELMHTYHLDRGTLRCAFKVDIQKAYDTVDWKFLHDMLVGFGFHPRMIGWIMECVTSTSFSLSINGSLHGYFKGKCVLRQGDPMPPYLFTVIMEVLTRMLNRRARDSNSFTYHRVGARFSKFVNWYRLGNGVMTSAWFDNWCSIGPIKCVISNRDIYSAGFRLNAKVWDIIDNGSWGWPNEWNLKYHNLVNIVVPRLSNTADHIIWRDRNNMDFEFFVAIIPRHVVHLWLVIKRKLKTHGSLRQWDVWEHLKRFTGMANMPSALNSIMDFLIPLAKMRSARSVIAKLIQEDDECADVDSSLEVAYLAYWSILELMSMLMDTGFSLVRVFRAGLKVECSSVDVLIFSHLQGYYTYGFSWEVYLRGRTVGCLTPMILLSDDFEALCTHKCFFPIGCIVSVLFIRFWSMSQVTLVV